MASVFAHAIVGAALWPLFRDEGAPKNTWLVGAGLAALPDIDVLAFRFGVAYGDLFGHRGITHSLLAAVVIGTLAALAYARGPSASRFRLRLAAYFVVAMASHGILDAMTTGGLGVAFFAPFDNSRYFFPWRPIAVSPIGVRPFFTARGRAVLANELAWVELPAIALACLGLFARRVMSERRVS